MGVKENFNQLNAFVCLRGWSCMCVCMCVCACIHECVCLWMHRLPYVATLSRGACQGVLHQQLEEPNCVTGTGVGLSPSSHPVHNRTEPLRSNLVWWTTTSSSITPDQSHSFRGHCVRAYCKCSLRRRQQKKKKKPGKAPELQSKRHCTVSGPQCKCLCFSFESGLWRGLSQMGNIGYSPRAEALAS